MASSHSSSSPPDNPPDSALSTSSYLRHVEAFTADSEAIPDVAGDRKYHRALKGEITRQCYNNLVASATNGKLRKHNYFIFTDGMSNGYFTFNNMTDYGDLPSTNKFGFITLSCQCHAFGGSRNCCKGNRAEIDVTGIDNPGGISSMDNRLHGYVSDICWVTSDAIGDNKLPPKGEIQAEPPSSDVPPNGSSQSLTTPTAMSPISPVPNGSPNSIIETSLGTPATSPTNTNIPTIQAMDVPGAATITFVSPMPTLAKEGQKGNGGGGGLSVGAWAGIAVAAAAVVVLMALMGYAISKRKKNETENYEDGVAQ
ncbi:hypothetical protein ACHAWF_014994 [Thalassiosira exigua]